MNKKIKIGINIFLILLVGIIAFLIIRQFLVEGKVRKEINELYSLIYAEQYDFDLIYGKLNKIISEDGYAIVENSAKEYLGDVFDKVLEFTKILNDEKIASILTIENYKNDGKDFKESKEYLKKTKQNILNLEAEMLGNLKEETIMAYIVDENLEDSYVNLYKSFNFAKSKELKNKKETIEKTVDDFVFRIEKEEEIIDFLVKNKNEWSIKGESINFNNEQLSNQYNEMISEINE